MLRTFQGQAQAPESMNYQAVIRDGSGNVLPSHAIGIQIRILQGSATGSSVYEETFTPTTNAYGSIAIQIGTGTVVSGTFNSIDWGANSHFVETAVDISGGTNYTVISTTQLMSVPYSLHANVADSLVGFEKHQDSEFPTGSIIISEESNNTALINKGFSIFGISQQPVIPLITNNSSNNTNYYENWNVVGSSHVTDETNTSYDYESKSSIFNYQDKIYIVHEASGKIITVDTVNGNFNDLNISVPNFTCNNSNSCNYKSSLWTGNNFYLYGGYDQNSNYYNDFWKFSPTTNSWTQINLPSNFFERLGCELHWNGTEIIFSGGFYNTTPYQSLIEKYNPNTNVWSTFNTTNIPSDRYWHSSLLGQGKLFIWGGTANSATGWSPSSDGAIYDFSTNLWTTLPSSPLTASSNFISFWSGTEFVIFIRDQGLGASYNPTTNTWTSLANTPFTGTECEGKHWCFDGQKLIFCIQPYSPTTENNKTYIYDPEDDNWRLLTNSITPKQDNYGSFFNQSKIISFGPDISYSLGWNNSSLNSNYTGNSKELTLYSFNKNYFSGNSQMGIEQTKVLYYYKKN